MLDYKSLMSDFGEYFKKTQEAYHTPGCSICLTKGDEVILSSGFGYKNLETKEPVDADTQFFIASNTKGFVALCAAILVDEGKLSWTTPVIEYIPWFRLYDEYATTRITLKDIFSHQTGLPDKRPHISNMRDKPVQEQRKEIVRKLRYIKPVCDIRTELHYNNAMYTLGSYLIGEMSGMLWEEFLTERVLRPLGMNNTFFNRIKARHSGNCAEHYYHDITDDTLKPYKMNSGSKEDAEKYNPYGASGCITSTANDMQNYLIMLSNEGQFAGKQIVSKENLNQMFNSAFAENWGYSFPELGNSAASLGWFSWGYRGKRIKEHGGFFGTKIIIMPSEKIGLSIFCNLNYFDYKNILSLQFNIHDRMLGLDQIDWIDRFDPLLSEEIKKGKEGHKKNTIEKVEGTQPSHALDDYCGQYETELAGACIISAKDDGLIIKFDEENIFPLEHYHYDTFRVYMEKYNYAFFVSFPANHKGEFDRLKMSDEDDARIRVKSDPSC